MDNLKEGDDESIKPDSCSEVKEDEDLDNLQNDSESEIKKKKDEKNMIDPEIIFNLLEKNSTLKCLEIGRVSDPDAIKSDLNYFIFPRIERELSCNNFTLKIYESKETFLLNSAKNKYKYHISILNELGLKMRKIFQKILELGLMIPLYLLLVLLMKTKPFALLTK
jgi:hypothetical protein